jgi:TM2 domain-containing membrane protein YozV
MHCPNCGAKAPAGQKFCRACGLGLERFAELLTELLPDAEDENVARARRRLRQLEKAAKIAGYASLAAVGILFAFLGVLTMINSHIGGGIGLSLFGIGIIAMLFFVRYESSLKKQVSGRFTSQPSLPPAETTNELLYEDQPWIAMSVTERTTSRLGEKIESSR